uniref:Undecaprenyl/decaprenyl-phosphate alpha-N-acetylglucosaminyl 1-phosphate transferase n=1 Tax=Geobacter metallireducens TaxID=28232 RepID=A0A831XFT2_GEOME
MSLITFFYILMTAMLASAIMIPPVSRIAVRFGGIDRPNDRKVHRDETPRLGGIAIFLSFLFSLLMFTDVDQTTRGFIAGALVVFLTGLLDDLAPLTPRQKFVGEVAAALVGLTMGGIWLESLGNLFGFGEISLGWFSKPFTVFAVVGMMNAINLIDGLDGLAAGVSAIACLAFGALGYWSGNPVLTLLAVGLLGSLVGFLWHNSYPARIFMGDSGSLFLGYCMGVFSVMLVNDARFHISPMLPVFILGVPLIDTLVVMGGRLRKGRGVFAPDRSHIHHRLLSLGVGHKMTVIVVYGVSYLFAISALLFRDLRGYQLAPLLLALAALFYFIVHKLSTSTKLRKLMNVFSNQPVRETAVYRRMVSFSGYLMVVIKYVLFAIIMLSLSVPIEESLGIAAGSALLLLLLSFVLLLMKSYWSNLFLQVMLYGSGAFIIFVMENFGRTATIMDLSVLGISKALFVVLLFLEAVKVFIRKRTGHLVSSPFEYFLFFLLLSVPLIPPELTRSYHIMAVVGESVVLFVAYKLILMRNTARNRKVIAITALALLVFVVKYCCAL